MRVQKVKLRPVAQRAGAVRGLRRLQFVLIACGLVLLSLSGGAMLLGRVQNRLALASFRERLARSPRAGSAGGAEAAFQVDTSRWSPERLKAYEESQKAGPGDSVAILHVPKIGLEVPVFEGTDELNLNRGVGFIEGTARPGKPGNVGIAGHRDGFFRGLMDIKAEDSMELETEHGKTHYRVESIQIVTPEDVFVLDATPEPALTLVTCYPFYFVGSAPQRYIVRAVATKPQSATAQPAR